MMNINDKLMKIFFNIDMNDIKDDRNKENKKENQINTMILDASKIFSFELSSSFNQIECLSLQNNLIRNISFINHLPNLYYLDLIGNYIENYKPLIKHGTFGFLSLSTPKNLFEKKILTLKQMNIIIFQVEIEDKSIYNNLITGNPNILVFNNSIVDFSKKIRIFNTVVGLRFYIRNLLSSDNEEMKLLKKKNQSINNMRNKNKDGTLSLRDILLEKRLKIRHRTTTNPKCVEIINFFEEYNKNLFYIFKANKSKFSNELLCYEERQKLLMIYQTLNYIGKYFSKDNGNYSALKKENTKMHLQKRLLHLKDFPYIDIDIFFYLEFSQYKEFVLSVIILYLLSIFSKDITFYLISLLFKKTKYYHQCENNKNKIDRNIKSICDMNKIYLFSYYYKIYDILFAYSDSYLDKIKDKLNLNSITDKINEILAYEEIFIKHFNSNDNDSQKNKVIMHDFIGFLFNMKIFQEIFNIFQFVNDFLIYNKLYEILENSFPKDINFFCEIQGLLLNYYNKYNEIKEPIADQNYNKIQKNYILGNKFHLKNCKFNKNVFLTYNRKIFRPSKTRMEKIENSKPLNDLRKEREKLSKQNYINNALKKFLIIKKEQKIQNKLKLELNNTPKRNEKYNSINNIGDKFYKTYNTFINIKHYNNLNLENSKEKMETFYNSQTLKSFSKSNKIKNLKALSIDIDNDQKNKNKLFNNNVILNHANGLNSKIISNDYKLNNKINSRYENEEKNILSSFEENYENEKELKQYSLTIDKNRKAKNYSMKLFKKGYMIYNHYKNDNGKLIKTSYDIQNHDKYNRTQKFSSFFF